MPSIRVAGLGDVLREWRTSQRCTHEEWAQKLYDAGLRMPIGEIEKNPQLQDIAKNLWLIEQNSEWPWHGQLVQSHPSLLRRVQPSLRGIGDPKKGLTVSFEPEKPVPVDLLFLDAVRRGIARSHGDDESLKRLVLCLDAVRRAELGM